jgi:murein L,D-transpeptidase YafK
MKEGDNKTPLGMYAIGTPKPSARFGVFIPVAYPTKEQAAAGLTGAEIGLHGPDRHFRFLGRLNVWLDWTAGCVAVESDEAIHEIAAWVKAKRVGFVQLH